MAQMEAWCNRDRRLGAALVVEDDIHMCALVASMARDLGFSGAIEVDSVAEALDRLVFDMVCVVLVDLSLGAEDGLELVKAIRRHPRPSVRFLPVVVMSRTSTEARIRDTIEAGADGFIAKPLSIGTFARQMHLALEKAARSQRPLADIVPPQARRARCGTFDID